MFVEAMGRERLFALLGGLPSRVNALVAPLSEAQLIWRPQRDEWSIKEVLCHLRDAEEIGGLRMRRIVTEERPFLPAFDQDAYARDRRYQEELTPTILPRYVEHRLGVLGLLREAPLEAWSRQGVHEEDGPVTLQEMAQRRADHDLGHLEQLRRLKEAALRAL